MKKIIKLSKGINVWVYAPEPAKLSKLEKEEIIKLTNEIVSKTNELNEKPKGLI